MIFTGYSYEDFCELVLMEVRKQYSEAKLVEVKKPNITSYKALTVPCIHISDKEKVGACISMPQMYELYSKKNFDFTLAEVFSMIDKSSYSVDRGMIQKIRSWDKSKNFIRERLVPQKGNEYLANQSPITPYLDMYIVYELRFDGANATITNQMLDEWGVSQKDVICAAEENRGKNKAEVMNMMNLLKTFGMTREEQEDIQTFTGAVDNQMIVITNSDRIHGASTLLDTKALDRAAKMAGADNLMIFPSSQHEIIAIRYGWHSMSIEEAREMVREINCSSVAAADRLTDSVYTYDAKTKEVALAEPEAKTINRKMSL